MRCDRRRAAWIALLVALTFAGAHEAVAQTTIVVSPAGPMPRIADAVRLANAGDTVLVTAGVYREPTIVIDKPLILLGRGRAVIDGELSREIVRVQANDVTIRGLRFENVGKSYREDRAALRVTESARCTIDGNTFENAFFGIYLAKSTDCRVTGNVLRASGTSSMTTANGIHLWASDRAVITGNEISGHRDGIYIEFSRDLVVMNNRSERNHRYGLHFMFSDDCAYRDNTFTDNGAGVAVMYAARTEMTGNTFADNRGTAAYGLLLKDITDGLVEGNRFIRNTTALLADGTTRLAVIGNTFEQNGWAVRLDASTQDSRVRGNAFSGNTFDLATNSSHTAAEISGNYWDRYAGYDLDRNGIGDVPHRPVRLFAVLAERFEPSMVLLRSFFVDLLDSAERLFPSLTPTTLLDASPAMRPPAGAAS